MDGQIAVIIEHADVAVVPMTANMDVSTIGVEDYCLVAIGICEVD